MEINVTKIYLLETLVVVQVGSKEVRQNSSQFNKGKCHQGNNSLTCSSLCSCFTSDSITLMLGKRSSNMVLGCSSTSNSSNTLETCVRSKR